MTKMAVPYFLRPSPVTGFFLMTSKYFFTFSLNSSGLSGSTGLESPVAAMAFRNLEPMMAPTPVLPAALCLSLIMLAKSTPFSPAGPMVATLVLPPSPTSSRIVSVALKVVMPQRCLASISSAFPSWMCR